MILPDFAYEKRGRAIGLADGYLAMKNAFALGNFKPDDKVNESFCQMMYDMIVRLTKRLRKDETLVGVLGEKGVRKAIDEFRSQYHKAQAG